MAKIVTQIDQTFVYDNYLILKRFLTTKIWLRCSGSNDHRSVMGWRRTSGHEEAEDSHGHAERTQHRQGIECRRPGVEISTESLEGAHGARAPVVDTSHCQVYSLVSYWLVGLPPNFEKRKYPSITCSIDHGLPSFSAMLKGPQKLCSLSADGV